ncbi:MAG: respiratory nitrate reductase subunit gamma [Alphaproteobacteria bacterium]|jgi:nitrate reductase gamma subunit|nr:respiratory nitrate reductase subunit gamma [Alphaproteobacteria bacterium]
MSEMTALFTILFYAATAILAVGLAFKVVQYARTPAPLKIPTTPAPVTTGGVVLRMAREVILFESLFKSNKWIWLFGYMFHGALLLAMMRHLRYFTHPVWEWVALVQPFGMYAGFAMLAGLGALWFRRIFVQRIRYISGPSDHLMLILLLGITGSGLAMTYVARTDIVALKQFMLGLIRFDWQPMPSDPILMAHLGMVIALMIIFPFSKLLHAPGLFFSPTRNQVDNAREKRHLAPWAAKLEAGGE